MDQPDIDPRISRPRILMVTASLGYGGAEGSFVRLGQYLSQFADVKVALMARDYGGGGYSSAKSAIAIPVVLLDCENCAARSPFAKLRRWSRMRRRLSELKISHDVTISFLSGPSLLNALTGDPSATIVSERGSKQYHVGIPPVRKWFYLTVLDPLIYRRAAKIVPASVGYSEEIANIAGPTMNHKIIPIEGGIAAEQLLAQTDGEVDEDIARFCVAPVAVFSNRLDRGKGVDLILQAFAHVRRKMPDARLLIIGDGPLRDELGRLCTAAGLTVTTEGAPLADVFFAGYRADPIRHFRLCRTFLFPSLHEGLPNSLIEGVASGVPVLAADCRWGPRSILSCPNDVALPDKLSAPVKLAHGILMPMPDTPNGLAAWEDQLYKAMQNPLGRRPLEERRAAIARFDIAVTGPQWLRLIEEIMSRQAERAANGGNMYGGRSIAPSSGRR